jgi:two-component system, NarL family, response regulator DegU
MKKHTIYIADDHTLFRKGMVRLLQSFDTVGLVKDAENGKDLIKLVKEEEPDLVLMDLEMPVMDGKVASEHLLNKYEDVKIVVLSMHGSENLVYEMLQLGVHSYLLKNAEPEEVRKAIDAVINNDFYYNRLMREVIKKSENGQLREKSTANVLDLSPREREIIVMICHELTMKEIGERLDLSERTVEKHRQNILQKLKVKNAVGIVKYAFEHNLFAAIQ